MRRIRAGAAAETTEAGPDPGRFRAAILEWFDREKRPLPWRETHDPYTVWVSEIMLQQTRVETVIPHFERFLRAFPDIRSLASAPEERVLALWSGLGYYSRARNLRKGAIALVHRWGGRFPQIRDSALTVPGVGPYTASAILSIAYGSPHAVVDGNVTRVLARLHLLAPPEDRNGRRLEALASRLLDRERPGDHNQAMMELGATLCLPRKPHCRRCPVPFACRAFLAGNPEAYPSARQRPKEPERRLVLLLARAGTGRLLLETGRWNLLPHLWLPPILEFGPGAVEPARDPAGIIARLGDLPGRIAQSLVRDSLREIGGFRHAITRHRLRFAVLAGRVDLGRGRLPKGFRLAGEQDLEQMGRSSILDKALGLERRGLTR